MLSNNGTKKFGAKERETEFARGRFSELKDDEKAPAPWHLTQDQCQDFDDRFSTFPFPAKFGSSPKKPFCDPASSALKANDYCHIISDIGVYCLGDEALGFDQRRVLQRLFRLLNRLTRSNLTVDGVLKLEGDLLECLAEFELFFPFFACTINFHLLVHFPSQLLRCGPAPCHWMYSMERECGRLVDSIHSFKCAEHSMARNYLITELIEHRRAGGLEYRSPIHRRLLWAHSGDAVSMLPLYLKQEAVCSLIGKSTLVKLSPSDQHELLLLWRQLDNQLDQLFCRYEAEVASGRASCPIVAWTPNDGGPALTPLEAVMRFAPCFHGKKYDRAYRNAMYLRAVSKDSKFQSTNCTFKARHPILGIVYGIVESFLYHQAFPHDDAPKSVFVKVTAWCKSLACHPDNGLQRCQPVLVKPSKSEDLPYFQSSYCCLGDCLPIPLSLVDVPKSNPPQYFAIKLGR
jgi:hypothetical protein